MIDFSSLKDIFVAKLEYLKDSYGLNLNISNIQIVENPIE